MIKGKKQLKVRITSQLYECLLGKSSQLGISITQMVEHIVVERAQQHFSSIGNHDEIYRK